MRVVGYVGGAAGIVEDWFCCMGGLSWELWDYCVLRCALRLQNRVCASVGRCAWPAGFEYL